MYCRLSSPDANTRGNHTQNEEAPGKPKLEKRKKAAAVIRTHRREIKKKIGNHFIFRVFSDSLSLSLCLLLWLSLYLGFIYFGCRVVVSLACACPLDLFYFLFGTWTIGIPSWSLFWVLLFIHLFALVSVIWAIFFSFFPRAQRN